jgi:3-keto-L-gulonate-6-phosphate decarboxylase
MRGPVTTQVSLDLTTIKEALEMARGARRAGIDWLEAGTPLILGEGLHAVKALRAEFPGVPIVADLKTMDGAGLEAEMMLGAGATHVVVMSRAHWASVATSAGSRRSTTSTPSSPPSTCPSRRWAGSRSSRPWRPSAAGPARS